MNLLQKSAIAITLLTFPLSALAATTPSLGAAATYGVLSDTYSNPIGPTTITGDVGFTTGPLVLPLGVHTNYGSGAPYATAGIDQATARAALDAQVCTFTFAAPAVVLDTTIEHLPTYGPGVYCSTGAMSIGTAGGITLSGAGTYIFRSGGALNAVTGTNVTLAGASACDVFWTPNGAVTLNANSTFVGTVIPTSQDITVLSTVSWIGRALSFGHTVTTSNANAIITAPTCAIPPTPGLPGSDSTGAHYFAQLPAINVTKVPSPLSLPLGPGPVTYTYHVTNIGEVAMNTIWVHDDKCAPTHYVSGDSNNDGLLDLTETWVYTCTKTVSQTETNVATTHGWGIGLGMDVYDTATAIVVVGLPITPPIIHLVKTANPTVLSAVGGLVVYSYAITNPGATPLSDVSISDDKCTGLPVRVTNHPGDLNNNNLLDPGETFYFSCSSTITQTTTNIGRAEGRANGLTAIDFSTATVLVNPPVGQVLGTSTPSFPDTGYTPRTTAKSVGDTLITVVVLVLVTAVAFVLRKRAA